MLRPRLPRMARSWTRLHEHLGAPPGPLSFDMVQRATDDRLQESDDLDWKEQLPQPPRDGRWNEFAKDVAAMANTRGGLLIFGITASMWDRFYTTDNPTAAVAASAVRMLRDAASIPDEDELTDADCWFTLQEAVRLARAAADLAARPAA